MQTDSFELVRLVATVCQRSENCPKGQVSWKGLFSNCYVTGRVLFRWVRATILRTGAYPREVDDFRAGAHEIVESVTGVEYCIRVAAVRDTEMAIRAQ